MAFESETNSEILTRILSSYGDEFDKRQGSVVHDMQSKMTIELARAYIALDTVLNLGFAQTSYGPYLEMRARERGLTKKPSVVAVGFVAFTGPEGTEIPEGTTLSTGGETPVAFETTEAATIGSSGAVTVMIQAQIGGVSGNVGPGTITLVNGELNGIIAVNNPQPLSGGFDEETDEAFLQRYLEDVQTPATTGNEADYRRWAKQISGVLDARIFRAWNGPGTVKVSLLADDKTAPSQNVIDEAAAYIESQRPLNAAVTVVGVEEVLVNLRMGLTLRDGADVNATVEQVRSNVRAYLEGLAFNDRVVRYSKVGEAILNAEDVIDYENLTINNGTGNVLIDEDQVAVMGAIVVSE